MNHYKAIVYSINYLADRGIKTADYMDRVISGLVRDLYDEKINKSEFEDSMSDLIEKQFKRAFNEAMRENDTKWNDKIDAAYQERVTNQYQYIEKFADDILAGKENETGYGQFTSRAELWANQYESTVNDAKLITGDKEDRYMWVMGATEEHCTTCASLDGVVATAEQWLASGFHPQEPPNDALTCGGWRCDCRYELTDEPVTEGFFQ